MKLLTTRMQSVRWYSLTLAVAVFSFALPANSQTTFHALPTSHVPEIVRAAKAPLIGSLPGSERLNLAFILVPSDQTALNKFLRNLYDKTSPSYHKFLTVQEFSDRFGPTPDNYAAVLQFATKNGMIVTHTTANRLVVDVSASVAQAERAFHVVLNVYRDPSKNRMFFAPDREPTLESTLHIWHVGGLDNFTVPKSFTVKGQNLGPNSGTTGSGPSGSFLGSDRRAAYYGGTSLTGSGQRVALFELDGYNMTDVQKYFNNVGQSLSVPINNVLIDGGTAGSDGDDTEQVIDIIEAASMAPGLAGIDVYIAPEATFQSGVQDTDIFEAMATASPLPNQISVSWGWKPDDPGSDDPIFDAFEAQGQSLFVASGDEGAYNSSSFAYPAEDANVTAVGGTDLTTAGAGGYWQSEIAWGGANIAASCPAGAGSGGGPSPDGIGIPSYQQTAGVINSQNHGSTSSRNVPDVAAEANCDNYYCANGSCGTGLGGTSLAAPTWAGFMALVNQHNSAEGKSPAGFINPQIYSASAGSEYGYYFNDMTTGDNYNSSSPNLYPATVAYDLVTGWGSPTPVTWLGYIPAAACAGYGSSFSCLDPEYNYLTASMTMACQGGISVTASAQACFYGSGCNQSNSNVVTNGLSPVYATVNSPYGVPGGAQGCSFNWQYGTNNGSLSLQPGQSEN